jgi:predicted MPP superfamily phosphohydrolase
MNDQTRLIIPDIHHKTRVVNNIRAAHPGTPAIFLGDYFDDFDDTPENMSTTCEWLKTALKDPADVFLLGNHCFAYLSYEMGVRWGFCSGWTVAKQQVFHEYFPGDALLRHCQWAMRAQDWLISHAGLSNDLYRAFSKRKTVEESLEAVREQIRQENLGFMSSLPSQLILYNAGLCLK